MSESKQAAAAPQPLFVLRGHQDSVQCLSFCDEDLWSGSSAGEVKCWSLRTRRLIAARSFPQSQGILNCVQAAGHVFVQERSGSLHAFDARAFQDLKAPHTTLATGSWSFCKCAVSESAGWLVSPGQKQSSVNMYSLGALKLEHTLICDDPDGKFGMCMCLLIVTPQECSALKAPILLVGGESGLLQVVNLQTNQVVQSIRLHKGAPVLSCELVAADKLVFVAAGPGTQLEKFRLEPDLTSLSVRSPIQLEGEGVNCVAARGDRRIFATAGWDHRVRVFSCKTYKPLALLKFHTASVQVVAYGAKGLFASAGKDKCIAVYELYP